MKIQIKKGITWIASILLFMVYGMIFHLSSDNAQTSSALSQRVTKFILHIYYSMNRSNSNVVVVPYVQVDETEAVIRKIAHFTEYSAVGFLSFLVILLWIDDWKKGCKILILQLLLSASLDEFHQYFVPGRYSSIKDVLIDTAGGICGAILIYLVMHRIAFRRQ